MLKIKKSILKYDLDYLYFTDDTDYIFRVNGKKYG